MYNCRHEGKLFPFMLLEEWSEIVENIYIKRINSKIYTPRHPASGHWAFVLF
jgi:hypothetical protein